MLVRELPKEKRLFYFKRDLEIAMRKYGIPSVIGSLTNPTFSINRELNKLEEVW